MSFIHAPLTASQTAACDAIAAVLLQDRDGIAVVRYDSIQVDTVKGHEMVRSVHLHVAAERDIPSNLPYPDDDLEHAAGDCWQEVWHSFDPVVSPIPGVSVMRVV